MAGKFGGSKVWFLVDGYNLISAKLQGLRAKVSSMTEESTGLGDQWAEFSPVDMMKAEVSQEGAFFDTSTANSHAALVSTIAYSPDPATSPKRIVALGQSGHTSGQPFWGFEGVYQQSYEVLGVVGKLTRANAEYVVTGQANLGVIVHALAAETADANTETTSVDQASVDGSHPVAIVSNSQANPSVVTTLTAHGLTTGDTVLIAGVAGSSPTINGERVATVISATTFSVPVDTSAGTGGTGGTFTRGKTQNGGVGYMEYTALTLGGYTDALVKLRHSADNITFIDLLSFTAVTGARGAERKTVAGTVNRYLAASLDLEGAGSGASFTYFAGFARS